MGYFSNGSEGDAFREEFCDRCVHGGGETACPVWSLHELFNYDQHMNATAKMVLDELIPRDHDGFNEECRLFKEKL